MTTEIESGEATIADGELFGSRVQGWLEHGHTVVLEHVEEGGLSGVVEAQEEKLGVFVEEPERGQNIPDYLN